MSYKIVYDSEAEIMSIRFKKDKSVDSDIKGNVVLDYNAKGELVNIDIMKFDMESLMQLPNQSKVRVI